MEDYSLIQFVPLDRTNERSIERVLALIDNTIQFGEDADVKTHVCMFVLVIVNCTLRNRAAVRTMTRTATGKEGSGHQQTSEPQ